MCHTDRRGEAGDRGSRMIDTRGARALVLGVVLCALVGCGASHVASVEAAAAPERIDLGDLKGQILFFSPSYDESLVPVVAHSSDGSRLGVLDVSTRRISSLSLPPGVRWLADVNAVTTRGKLLVSANVCPDRPVEGDAGYECPSPEGSEAWVFVLDLATGVWSSVALPDAYAAPGPTAVDDDGVQLTGSVLDPSERSGARTQVWTTQFDPLRVSVSDKAPDVAMTCGITDGALELTETGAESRGRLVDKNGSVTEVVLPHPVTPMSLGGETAGDCVSSGRYVAYFGTPGPESEPTALPSGPAPVETKVRLDPPPKPYRGATPGLSVYDLTRPGADPQVVGDSSTLQSFAANPNGWVMADAGGLWVFDASTGRTSHVDLPPRVQVRSGPAGTLVIASNASGHTTKVDLYR